MVGGLFVNHLFAKVGLFWLAGHVGGKRLPDWSVLSGRPATILLFGILLAAISGFPPFPGFWAKWQLVLSLAAGERYVWIAIVLAGSLLEAAYLFRWFGRIVHSPAKADEPARAGTALLPVFAMVLLLVGERHASPRCSQASARRGCSCRSLRASHSSCSSGSNGWTRG